MENPKYSRFWLWALVPVFNFIAFIHAAVVTKQVKYYLLAFIAFLPNFLLEEESDVRTAIWLACHVILVIWAYRLREKVTLEQHKAQLEKHRADARVLENMQRLNQQFGVSQAPVPPKPTGAPLPAGPVMVERVIIKEIVKIPCAYCGSLVENTESRCPQCGGDIR